MEPNSSGCLVRLLQGFGGAVLGSVAGLAAGGSVAGVALAVQQHGMSSEGGPEAIFGVGVTFCFAVVGTLVGAIGGALCPDRRCGLGLLLGSAAGLVGALVVSLVGGWLAHASFDCLVVVAIAGLVLVTAGAVIGGVANKRLVSDRLLPEGSRAGPAADGREVR